MPRFLAVDYFAQAVQENNSLMERLQLTAPMLLDEPDQYPHNGRLTTEAATYRKPWCKAPIDRSLLFDRASEEVLGELKKMSSCISSLEPMNCSFNQRNPDFIYSSQNSLTDEELFAADFQHLKQLQLQKNKNQGDFSEDILNKAEHYLEEPIETMIQSSPAKPSLENLLQRLKPQNIPDPLCFETDTKKKSLKCLQPDMKYETEFINQPQRTVSEVFKKENIPVEVDCIEERLVIQEQQNILTQRLSVSQLKALMSSSVEDTETVDLYIRKEASLMFSPDRITDIQRNTFAVETDRCNETPDMKFLEPTIPDKPACIKHSFKDLKDRVQLEVEPLQKDSGKFDLTERLKRRNIKTMQSDLVSSFPKPTKQLLNLPSEKKISPAEWNLVAPEKSKTLETKNSPKTFNKNTTKTGESNQIAKQIVSRNDANAENLKTSVSMDKAHKSLIPIGSGGKQIQPRRPSAMSDPLDNFLKMRGAERAECMKEEVASKVEISPLKTERPKQFTDKPTRNMVSSIVVDVHLSDEYKKLLELLVKHAEPLMKVLKAKGLLPAMQTFIAFTPDVTRYILRQHEKVRKGSDQQGVITPEYEAMVIIHVLTGTMDNLVHCSLSSAISHLRDIYDKNTEQLGAYLEPILRCLFDAHCAHTQSSLLHPKAAAFGRNVTAWLRQQRLALCTFTPKVLVLMKRNTEASLAHMKSTCNLINCLNPCVVRDEKQIPAMLRQHNCIITTSVMKESSSIDMFNLMVDYEFNDMAPCNERQISFIGLKLQIENTVCSAHEVWAAASLNSVPLKQPETKLKRKTTLIASHNIMQQIKLVQILENQNCDLIERNFEEASDTIAFADIIVDPESCVILSKDDVICINVDAFTQRVVMLSEKFTLCWVLLQTTATSSATQSALNFISNIRLAQRLLMDVSLERVLRMEPQELQKKCPWLSLSSAEMSQNVTMHLRKHCNQQQEEQMYSVHSQDQSLDELVSYGPVGQAYTDQVSPDWSPQPQDLRPNAFTRAVMEDSFDVPHNESIIAGFLDDRVVEDVLKNPLEFLQGSSTQWSSRSPFDSPDSGPKAVRATAPVTPQRRREPMQAMHLLPSTQSSSNQQNNRWIHQNFQPSQRIRQGSELSREKFGKILLTPSKKRKLSYEAIPGMKGGQTRLTFL
ncbi:hypothetical protein CAPTEDRAFT_214310 [Capitella teleta]|uniref:Uncharacterized protein n=1 Tax=Capitella teleta TaxID=283909 RepID=R7VIM8_CAPTE|nr:hypothetical protein CAPTEDRAFT_214310 [Capitella teleta]|eukprot:ELU16146.1 hypothetical protein CAPTEDRAFT_214310 [Capitella teleta]